MNAEIKTYNGQAATFYIQAKGLNAGKPLKQPIPNSFAVNTEIEHAFELVYSLWNAGLFKNHIGGSCIPYIRLSAVKKLLAPHLNETVTNRFKPVFEKVAACDKAIENMEKQLALLKDLKKSYSRQIFKK